ARGRNSSQQCHVPSRTYPDVAAGEVFSAAIRSNGTLAAWGTTWNGETSVPSGSNYVKISAQSRHGLALKTDGTLVGWGVNWNNQLNIPAGFTYTDMSAGWFHSLAVKTDGSLVGWGLDGNLQSSIPSGATGIPFASVSAGMHFSVALTAPVADADADGDGVPDDLDEYPDDSERAFDVVYPSPGGWGTLAYEDMWPKKGDYDFNDLVLDYQIILVMNSENHIKDVKANLELKAVGATFQNAFAVEFPFPVSTIASHSGLGNSQPYNMPLIEAGTHSILNVISNTNDFVSVPGHDVFWNTQPSQPSYDPIPISFEIILNTPLDPNDFPDWGVANPYLMVNRVQGHEVHLPGYPPTIHADTNLFGMDDDTTDPGSGRYYKTANNLPWALDIPVRWKYPIEKIQITRGYLAFAPWAESGGTQYENWYELISGQINSDNIYNP
ncbi:MAG: LruC domain-containing protein, partial [Candidatus Cloacimonetes bacterium]|nr:LruC domain-containing protein [Candidatus Cloacimonadota bacterium]